MKIKYRLRFSKQDRLRFIGHLDLLKLFQRCIKRAGIPIAYSSGFNPHSLLYFALPLPLGMGSTGEYAELALTEEVPVDSLIAGINCFLPKGISIMQARPMLPKEKSAASLVAGGLYELQLPGAQNPELAVAALLGSERVEAEDVRKKKKIDIRPKVFELEALSEDRVRAVIATGSSVHLKPELLSLALYEKMEQSPSPDTVITRRELYKNQNGTWISLYEE